MSGQGICGTRRWQVKEGAETRSRGGNGRRDGVAGNFHTYIAGGIFDCDPPENELKRE